MAIDVTLENENGSDDSTTTLTGMYKEYFLDYASYVILERAVPDIDDGLKPVQRRILHSMKKMDDGRFHKVANIIGQTMAFHPHGDAAIGAALVNLGQKDLLIDCQGNWGDIRTGDSAAAARYIEARLTKFALEVLFNPQTTDWQLSYDGRNKEPITLPAKFPLVLAQGVEGIAVGLSTKIMPHNFIEIIKASIKILEGKKVKIYPDFQTGGSVDVSEYNDGKRGGKIKVRAKIESIDKNTIAITELPYGVTTNSLIDSILKANDKGQIKVKKVVDNTAADVEVRIDLASGISPDVTTDALYAFTNCEVSISPNACVIVDNKPKFLTVSDILEISTEQTKQLLKMELEIKKGELEEKWHMASLEKVFIENRIYRDIEECESWEEVLEAIDLGLKKFVATPSDTKPGDARLKMMRDITTEDITKLTEIKIKRISKYNSFKADENIASIEEELKQVQYDLDHLTEFAIAFFDNLLTKYGKGRERRTEIASFETIRVRQVVANNAKLYVNYKEGFIGTGMKKDEFVMDCSDISDVIAFMKDGSFKVVRISDKVFVGKNIIHASVWKKGDERTTYNMIYVDATTGRSMAKRFNVKSITRDKTYDLTKGAKGSKLHYFTVNPNGESEIVNVQLSPGCSAKKKVFEFDFGEIGIKGRGAGGNIVTKYPVRKITQISIGKSSLGAIKVWMDEVSGRLNTAERGIFLGAFDTGDNVIALYKDGTYEINELDLNKKYDVGRVVEVARSNSETVISVVYFEGEKEWTMIKRFEIETQKMDTKYPFISESSGSKLYFATTSPNPIVKYSHKSGGVKQEEEVNLSSFIDVKGWKAMGNKVGEYKILKIQHLNPPKLEVEEEKEDKKEEVKPEGDLFNQSAQINTSIGTSKKPDDNNDELKAGDIIDLDI
ncbi:MAG: DNA gyrase/topoisomerase IV subunit A [Saprospiraceae bacterium]|nr:DNA gyrase/topoisomerase IV subunit A [Saprospiraceae bacterium]